MTQWLDIPLGQRPGRKAPTWGALAERFDRCSRRVASYVGPRVRDRRTFERIVTETLQRNLELLAAEHDELEEVRRLTTTADRLIATSVAARGPRGSRP